MFKSLLVLSILGGAMVSSPAQAIYKTPAKKENAGREGGGSRPKPTAPGKNESLVLVKKSKLIVKGLAEQIARIDFDPNVNAAILSLNPSPQMYELLQVNLSPRLDKKDSALVEILENALIEVQSSPCLDKNGQPGLTSVTLQGQDASICIYTNAKSLQSKSLYSQELGRQLVLALKNDPSLAEEFHRMLERLQAL